MTTEQMFAKLKLAQRKLEDAYELVYEAGALCAEVTEDSPIAGIHECAILNDSRFRDLRMPLQAKAGVLVKIQGIMRQKERGEHETSS